MVFLFDLRRYKGVVFPFGLRRYKVWLFRTPHTQTHRHRERDIRWTLSIYRISTLEKPPGFREDITPGRGGEKKENKVGKLWAAAAAAAKWYK